MLKKLKSIFAKKSIKNGIWIYALQFFNLVVPLLTLPYVTRVLGSSLYGIFSVSLNIISYMQVIVEYGFVMSATRKVALEGKKNINIHYTLVVTGRIMLLSICMVFSVIYVIINKTNIQLCMSFCILLISLFGYCVQMNWLFQGLQEMKYISIVNIIGRTISTILIFIFVKTKNDLFLYSLLYSISPFLSGLIGLLIAKKRYSLKLVKVKIGDVLGGLKDAFYIFTTQINAKIFCTIGITFLGVFAESSVTGKFSAIQKIPNILLLLWTPIAQVIYPISSQHFEKGFLEGYRFVKKIRIMIMPLFVVMAIIVAILSKFCVQILFGMEYAEYSYWLFPLLGWMLVAIDNNFVGIQILLGSGHDKEYSFAFNIGVICTVTINLGLIFIFGGDGAAFAPLISELLLNLLLRVKARPLLKQSI